MPALVNSLRAASSLGQASAYRLAFMSARPSAKSARAAA